MLLNNTGSRTRACCGRLSLIALVVIFIPGCSCCLPFIAKQDNSLFNYDNISSASSELTYLLPKNDTELVGGTETKVSVNLALQPDLTEPIEYRADLMVNEHLYDPFLITSLPGTNGTAVASWYVCVTAPQFSTIIRFRAKGKNTGKTYSFTEVSRKFQVESIRFLGLVFNITTTR
jgi:hypothetical protein